MSLDTVTISIPNWEKFNPRSDRGNYTWFRFENAFFNDQEVFGLSPLHKLLFIFIACEASKKNGKAMSLRLSYISALGGFSTEQVLSGLSALKETELIDCDLSVVMTSLSRHEDTKCPATERNGTYVTEQNETLGHTEKIIQNRKTKSKDTPESLRAREQIKFEWIKAYKARYSFEPTDTTSVFFRTHLKKVHQALGEERAIKAIKAFLAWDNPQVVMKAHPLWLMLPNLDSLRADHVNPKAKYDALARGRAQQTVMTEEGQRMEEMKAYAKRGSERTTAIDYGDSKSGGVQISDSAERELPESRGDTFGEQLAFEPEPS